MSTSASAVTARAVVIIICREYILHTAQCTSCRCLISKRTSDNIVYRLMFYSNPWHFMWHKRMFASLILVSAYSTTPRHCRLPLFVFDKTIIRFRCEIILVSSHGIRCRLIWLLSRFSVMPCTSTSSVWTASFNWKRTLAWCIYSGWWNGGLPPVFTVEWHANPLF